MRLNGRKVIFLLTIAYTLLLLYWMFFGFGRKTQLQYRYNLIPLSTIRLYLRGRNLRAYNFIINIFGNIGVFIPFGLLLPSCFQEQCRRRPYRRALLFFLPGLLLLETLQLLLKRGAFDVDDILLNTLGFVAGLLIYRVIHRITDRKKPPPATPREFR